MSRKAGNRMYRNGWRRKESKENRKKEKGITKNGEAEKKEINDDEKLKIKN